MSSRAGSLWRQIFNVQCPYKRKASVKATRASLCYSEPCWLFAFADMYGVAELSHFSQIKPKLVMSFSMFAQFWSWSKTIFTHFTKELIPFVPLPFLGLQGLLGISGLWASQPGNPRSSGPPFPLRTHGPPRPPQCWRPSWKPSTLRRPRRPMCPETT